MGKKGKSKKRANVPPKNEPEPESGSSLGATASVPEPIGNPTTSGGYNPGDLVHEGFPLVFVVKDEYARTLCHYCLAVCDDPTAECPKCKFSRYCTADCRLNDTWHVYECPFLERAAPFYPPAFIRYIAQAVTKAKSDEWDANGDVLGKNAITFSDLECCRHQIGIHPLYSKMCEYFGIVVEYLGRDNVVTLNEFKEMYCKAIKYICKVYSPFSFRSKALGLYLGFGFFTHSCVPNAIQTWSGRKMSVRMMESVDRKSNLLITVNMLGYRSLEYKGREEKMLKLCIARCYCRRCEDLEENDKFDALVCAVPTQAVQRVLCVNSLLRRMAKAEDADPAQMLKFGLPAWDEMARMFDSLHVVRAKISRYLCYAYFRLTRFKEATVYCLKYQQFCEAYYGPNHIRSALCYLILSLLDALQDKSPAAARNFDLAAEKFVLCLGKDHPNLECLITDYSFLTMNGGWTAKNIKETLLFTHLFRGRAFEF